MPTNQVPLTITVISTAVAWFAWILTIARTDPTTAGAIGFALFYLTLLAAVAGSAAVVGLFVRRHAADAHRSIRIAIRQGVLTGFAVTIGVFLQTKELLTWWNFVFLIAALTLLELFIVSLRRVAPDESTNAGESTYPNP